MFRRLWGLDRRGQAEPVDLAGKRGPFRLHRSNLMKRLFAGLAIVLGLIGAARAQTASRTDVTLRVGDQIAGVRSILEAANALEGLPYKIEWSQFPAAAPLLEALNAGALDVGFTGDIPFLFVYAAGAPIRVIGASRSLPASNAVLVPRNSPARSFADLRGKRIAVNRGGNGHFQALGLIEQAGLKPGDFTLVFLGPTDARSAFVTGAVDAWIIWEPYVSISSIEDGARVVADATDVFPSKTFVHAHLDAIRDKRAALQDFNDRVARAKLWALAHPVAIARISSGLTRIPEATALRSLDTKRETPIAIDDTVVRETQGEADLFARHGVLPGRIDVTAAFDRSFTARPSLGN